MPSTAKRRAPPPLVAIAQSFPRRRVLVVGDLVADHYIYGQTDRVSREAPVLIVRYEDSDVKPGAAANAAANARALGAQVRVLGALGRDEMGRTLRGKLEALGIEVCAVHSGSVQTETKTRILAGGLSTTRQQMLRLDRTRTEPLPARVRAQLAATFEQAARGVDAIVVSDYGAGVLTDELRARLRAAAAAGVPVCVDSRYALASFVGLTVCKPNEPELAALLGRPITSEPAFVEAGWAALERLRCRTLLVTRGHHGMALFGDDGQLETLPVHGADEAVDVTGAGDTVIAAFTLGLAAGAAALDAARIANVAGGISVMKPGTATVSRAELLGELEPR